MNVYITKVAKFFPNEPVENDDMESYLGMVDGKPSKARRIVLRRNGIKQRYYAFDKQGNVTHTNVQMAANAVRGLFDEHFSLDDVDLLSCGTASPEQIVPSHGVMVHGELGGSKNIEVVSFAGSCCTGVDALKYACMAVELGMSKNAVVSASERASAWMHASYFQKESEQLAQLEQQPMLAFQKEFLRWMLSDGALALHLEGKPNETGLSLKVDWIEITSFAGKMETCMYAGAEKEPDGELKGWTLFPEQEWLDKSVFAVKQDTRLLSEYIVPLGIDFLIPCDEVNVAVELRHLRDEDRRRTHMKTLGIHDFCFLRYHSDPPYRSCVPGAIPRGIALPDTFIIYTFSRGAQPSGAARHYACGCFFLRIANISIPTTEPANRAMI